MKDSETLTREEAREFVEPVFSNTATENTRSIQQSEPDSQFVFTDIIGREAYRLSPLSEW
jgi:hypothetical protein